MPIERRGAGWLPYAAVGLSVISIGIAGVCMILGPCFGAGMAVVGIYVTNQSHSAVTDANQKQLSDDLHKVGEDVKEIRAQNTARVATEATTASNITHLTEGLRAEADERKRETDKLTHEVDEAGKLITAYANKGKVK